MLHPRIIPCLLVRNGALVKTVQFENAKYVGDPLNAVRILNEKQVDELLVVDIDATVQNREPDYSLISNLAAECRMPLCYGGGVKTSRQVERIIGLGVEKVALSSAAVTTSDVISDAAVRVGSQSVVVVLDARKTEAQSRYEVFTHNATRSTGLEPAAFARQAADLGAGEIVVNSIDRDGGMQGYDLELAGQIREVTTLPLTVLGGAGSLADIAALIRRFGIIGAAAGSLFVFKGRFRAVLINYPRRADKDALVARAMGWSGL